MTKQVEEPTERDQDEDGVDDTEETSRVSDAPENQQERCKLLRNAVGNEVEISLHYDSSAVRIGVEMVLRDLFGATPQVPRYTLPNGVTVHWNPVQKGGNLYAPLFVGDDPAIPCSRGQVRQATEQRRDAMKAAFRPAAMPAVTVVELDGRDKYFPRYRDPKTAVRKGLAHTARLSQFLTPPPDNLPADWLDMSQDNQWNRKEEGIVNGFRSRVTNAVLDALRQLGVQMPVTCRAKQSPLNENDPLACVHYVGYWLAKHTKGGSRTGVGGNLPLFIKVDGATGVVTARTMRVGPKGAQTWMPYRELLLRLGRDEYEPMMPWSSRDRFTQFTKETVEKEFFGDNYLLLTHAQNSRSDSWPYLANTRLQQNRIGFEANTTADPATAFAGLRVVRVRDCADSETPQSFVVKGSEERAELLAPAGGKGIYPLGSNTFYIRTKRPDTIRVSATMSKLTAFSGRDRDGNRVSPQAEEQAPHVRLLEFVAFGLQPGDNAFAWAALTLKLCEAATHFGGETLLPLPLHLAEKVEEYLHPLPTDETDEDEEDV